jgi:RNA ligase (TIGR02306 family)
MEKLESAIEDLQIKRKLASVQEVASLTSIELDPNLEVAKVLGWQVVVPKGEFKVGDLVVYFEIDSKLQEDRWNEDLQFYNYCVSTITIAGELSQGYIALIQRVLPKNHQSFKIGDDLTEVLEVVKYDLEGESARIVENMEYPIHVLPFTDEPRVQSEPRYLQLFEGKPFVATIKYDGTSSTYLLNPDDQDELWVCSRNQRVDPKKKNDYWKIAEKYKIKEKLQAHPDYALQGEVYGPGIQKNLLGVKDKMLAVFNIYSHSQRRCLDYDELVEVCRKIELPYVKELIRGDSFKYSIEELFDLVKGNYEGTQNQREGLVFRLQKNWYMPSLRASFKIISNDFLVNK